MVNANNKAKLFLPSNRGGTYILKQYIIIKTQSRTAWNKSST